MNDAWLCPPRVSDVVSHEAWVLSVDVVDKMED